MCVSKFENEVNKYSLEVNNWPEIKQSDWSIQTSHSTILFMFEVYYFVNEKGLQRTRAFHSDIAVVDQERLFFYWSCRHGAQAKFSTTAKLVLWL